MAQKHCTSCGSPISDGQGNSCSMCFGDPEYGKDGYYRRWLEQEPEPEQEQEREQEQEER